MQLVPLRLRGEAEIAGAEVCGLHLCLVSGVAFFQKVTPVGGAGVDAVQMLQQIGAQREIAGCVAVRIKVVPVRTADGPFCLCPAVVPQADGGKRDVVEPVAVKGHAVVLL